MSWELNRIGDLCRVKSGKRLPKGMSVQNEPTNRKYLRVTDLKSHVVDESDIKYITEDIFKLISKYTINRDDIYISIAGTIGKVGIIPDSINGISLTENCSKLTELNKSKISQLFLMYYLRSYEGQSKMQSKTGGASQPKLAITRLKDIFIPTPPLQTQKRIADILSVYDNLIENNLKRIKLLEQAAQNIYKEWFVNLRFPGHENNSINEETGLPVGWKIGVISDFGKVVTGKTPSTKRSDFYGGHIPFIKTPDMHGFPYVIETSNNLTELGQQAQLNKNLPANSVLVSCIGTAGVVAMTSKLSQTNQQINSVVFESTFKSYYFYCFAKTLRPLLEGLGSNGATMVNVNKGKFENVDLNIPIEGLLVEYAKIAEPMFNQMLILSIQNQKLKSARDILLPRLMNRTIEV